jgi:uncharacterized protein (TIGR02996 family)
MNVKSYARAALAVSPHLRYATAVRRYAESPLSSDDAAGDDAPWTTPPGHTHAEFLGYIRDNPNDPGGLAAYVDWLHEQGLPHTAGFVQQAANMADTRKHFRRFWTSTAWPSDAYLGPVWRGQTPDPRENVADRFVSVTRLGPVSESRRHVALMQRSEDGQHAYWQLEVPDEATAMEWERRLYAEGAAIPLHRRTAKLGTPRRTRYY